MKFIRALNLITAHYYSCLGINRSSEWVMPICRNMAEYWRYKPLPSILMPPIAELFCLPISYFKQSHSQGGWLTQVLSGVWSRWVPPGPLLRGWECAPPRSSPPRWAPLTRPSCGGSGKVILVNTPPLPHLLPGANCMMVGMWHRRCDVRVWVYHMSFWGQWVG